MRFWLMFEYVGCVFSGVVNLAVKKKLRVRGLRDVQLFGYFGYALPYLLL